MSCYQSAWLKFWLCSTFHLLARDTHSRRQQTVTQVLGSQLPCRRPQMPISWLEPSLLLLSKQDQADALIIYNVLSIEDHTCLIVDDMEVHFLYNCSYQNNCGNKVTGTESLLVKYHCFSYCLLIL